MKYRFLLWRDKLLFLTLVSVFYAYSTYLRVALRAILEGSEFSWAYYAGITADGSAAVVQGQGLHGHLSFILVQGFVLLWLLSTGLSKPDRFFRAALAGWTTINMVTGLWLASAFGDNLTVEKQTLGLSGLSFMWTHLLPEAVAWLLSVGLLVSGFMRGDRPLPSRWTRLNAVLLGTSLMMLLLAGYLLNAGPQHGTADFNGMGALYAAIFLFLVGMAPWQRDTDSATAPAQSS